MNCQCAENESCPNCTNTRAGDRIDRCPTCGWTVIEGRCACDGWVRTSVQLPPEGKLVLCFGNNRYMVVTLEGDMRWYLTGENCLGWLWEPTWWRLLPDPPPEKRLDGKPLP